MSDPGQSATSPLVQLRARIAAPSGKKRVDALLSAEDTTAAIAELSVLEFYGLVAQVGMSDCQELISYAPPELIRGCMDIDSWDKDRLNAEALSPWMDSCLEAGFERFGQVWNSLDPEFGALYLARHCRIYDLSLGEDPDYDSEIGEEPFFKTPDTFFAIRIVSEDATVERIVHRIIDDLYRFDMVVARHALMAARSELPTELEENCYRWRTGRLQDLGYPEFHEALEVFRPIAPRSVKIPDATEPPQAPREAHQAHQGSPAIADPDASLGPGKLPAHMAEALLGLQFLAACLRRDLSPEKIQHIEASMMSLVNKVLSAGRVRPGDREAMEVATEHALSTLALGLEQLSNGDAALGARALQSMSLTEIHRLGYTMTLRLGRLAKALAPRASVAGHVSQAVLAALMMPRPFFAAEVEGKAGLRPFASRKDLAAIAEHLTTLAIRQSLAELLGADLGALSKAPEPRPMLDDFLRTALLRAAIGDTFCADALTAAELGQIEEVCFDQGKISADCRNKMQHALVAFLDEAAVTDGRQLIDALLNSSILRLEEELGGISNLSKADPKALGGIILAAPKS